MANFPCAFTNPCPGLGVPFLNLSAEFIDVLDLKIDRGTPDPWLGDFVPVGVTPWFPPPPLPSGDITPGTLDQIITQTDITLRKHPPAKVPNQPQTCCKACNGGKLCYTIGAGRIHAANQAQANEIAFALACYFARQFNCLIPTPIGRFFVQVPPIPLSGGTDRSYVGIITPKGGLLPYRLNDISGSLLNEGISPFEPPPPGLIGVGGLPNNPGLFAVNVTVSDSSGQTLTRTFPVNILGISNPNITNGIIGQIYGYQLLVAGNTGPCTVQLVSGNTPVGLGIDSTGNITGIPTTLQTVNFAVLVIDPDGNTCHVPLAMTVTDNCTPDTGPSVPTTLLTPISPTIVASATVTPANIFGNSVALGPSLGPGSYEIDYVSGHFDRLRLDTNHDLYTFYPGVGALILTTDGAQLPGTMQPCFSANVDAGTLALNPALTAFITSAKTYQLYCNLGNITCTNQTVPNSDTGSIHYNLVKTGTVNQPSRVRVANYLAANFGTITGCGNGGYVNIWDGTLPVQYFPAATTLKYWPAGSAFPNIAVFLIQNSAASIELLYNPNYFGSSGAWTLTIACKIGGTIWAGIKAVGLDPTGTYVRLAGSQQASGPNCLHIQSY